jgi:hypothetical protein
MTSFIRAGRVDAIIRSTSTPFVMALVAQLTLASTGVRTLPSSDASP